MYINLLPFFELDVIDGLILLLVDLVSDVLIDGEIDCDFEVEIFLPVDIAHTIAKLGFTDVPLLSESL